MIWNVFLALIVHIGTVRTLLKTILDAFDIEGKNYSEDWDEDDYENDDEYEYEDAVPDKIMSPNYCRDFLAEDFTYSYPHVTIAR